MFCPHWLESFAVEHDSMRASKRVKPENRKYLHVILVHLGRASAVDILSASRAGPYPLNPYPHHPPTVVSTVSVSSAYGHRTTAIEQRP